MDFIRPRNPWRAALLAAACAAGFVSTGSPALAQLDVQLQIPRNLYIRFEPIVVTVSITNRSGQAILLEDRDSSPWFGFEISTREGYPIAPRKTLVGKEPIRIGAGEMLRRQVNLTPLYALDEYGTYKIRAKVMDPVVQRIHLSAPVAIEMSDGRLIWEQTVGHPEEGTKRKLTLLTHRMTNSTALYLRIQDPDRGRVFCTHRLGKFLTYREPEVEIDANNQIHILHLHAPKSYTYSHIGLNGEILERKSFVMGATAPKLTREAGGKIAVTGGAVIDPNVPTPDEMTPGISQRPVPLPGEGGPKLPPAPAPSPTPKKSIWPFGRKSQDSPAQ